MGLQVLVVDDELTIGLMIEDMLEMIGHEVVEVATQLETGLAAARALEIDFALLDINLAGVESFGVAAVLRRRGIPFAFVTGYDQIALPENLDGSWVLRKPFMARDLERLMARVEAAGEQGKPH